MLEALRVPPQKRPRAKSMPLKLLCAGDIHLGRRPSGLSEEVRHHVDPRHLGPAAAWRLTVDAAIENDVDGVLLAGDLVDRSDDIYEAFEPLSTGVDRLVAARIPVLAVAGNHDGLVLPRLAAAIGDFRLLGRGGRWEQAEIRGEDGAGARILGWSFPQEAVCEDPLAAAPPAPDDDLPTLGLLHCDRDASGSRYAPVRSSALANHWADAWLLGHIHKPDLLDGSRPSGYLGAISALDPSDLGPRGPWIVEVAGKGAVRAEQLSLSPLRYEQLDIDVGDLPDADALPSRIATEIGRIADAMNGAPRALGVRIRLVGRTDYRRALAKAADGVGKLVLPRGDTTLFVQRLSFDTRPVRDLSEIAEGGRDPLALLAARLLLLDREPSDADRKALLHGARMRLEKVVRKPSYLSLTAAKLDDGELARLLRDAALDAIDQLESGREEGSA